MRNLKEVLQEEILDFDNFKKYVDENLNYKHQNIEVTLKNLGMSVKDLALYAVNPLLYYQSLHFSEKSLACFYPYNPTVEPEKQKAVLLIKNIIESDLDLFPNLHIDLDSHDKKIISTFVQWLPSTIGRCFVSDAIKYHKFNKISLKESFLLSFIKENTRQTGINYNSTLLEALVSDYENGVFREIDYDTFEVIQHLVIWFSTKEGLQYLKDILPNNHAVQSLTV